MLKISLKFWRDYPYRSEKNHQIFTKECSCKLRKFHSRIEKSPECSVFLLFQTL